MKRTVKHLGIIVFLFTTGNVFFTSCTKQNDTVIVYRDSSIIQYRDTSVNLVGDTTPNKQTYILFLNAGANTSSTTPIYSGTLPLFNKANYVGGDSIVFVCAGYNYSNNGGTPGSFVADLYDATDSVVIAGSAITISDLSPTAASPLVYHVSANIYSALPAKPITLLVRVASSSTTNNGVAVTPFLLVYK